MGTKGQLKIILAWDSLEQEGLGAPSRGSGVGEWGSLQTVLLADSALGLRGLGPSWSPWHDLSTLWEHHPVTRGFGGIWAQGDP